MLYVMLPLLLSITSKIKTPFFQYPLITIIVKINDFEELKNKVLKSLYIINLYNDYLTR